MRGKPNRRFVLGIILIASLGVKPAFACTTDGDCDDAVTCMDDTCVAGACVFTPNDANCPDNGLFCNGTESCDALLDCVSSGDPCPVGEFCNETTDTCFDCFDDSDCDDSNLCTDEACIVDTCEYTYNTDPCDDGDICTGPEDECSVGHCVGPHILNCCDTVEDCEDYEGCTDDSCDANACTHTNVSAGTPCGSNIDDDCTDPDTCDGSGNCQPNNAPDGTSCPGAEPCTAPPCSKPKYCLKASSPAAFPKAARATGRRRSWWV